MTPPQAILAAERAEICRLARRLRPDGLVVETSGNLSARHGELVAITPSGLDYECLTPERVAVVTLDGAVVAGELAPSTELPIHLAAYARTGAGAVAHTHSPFATALACARDELPPIHYLLAELGGRVRVAPYARFGSPALADALADALQGRFAALLRNHGAITIGQTPAGAYSRAVTLEWLCALYARACALGEPALMSDPELEEAIAGMAGYGQAVARPR